jgi:glycosyltransferase involved in cell wall biosynthesis
MQTTKILLIIPAYNEEKSIAETINRIKKYNSNKSTKIKLNYIVINDGSSDKTAEVLEDEKIPHINLIENLGIGGAVQTGYKYASEKNYDIAIQFDGDGQHDVYSVSNLINPLINNEADLVVGSRYINSDENNFKSTIMRQFGIKLISFFIKMVTGKKIFDTTSGYRAVNKELINYFSDNYPLSYPEPESEAQILKKGYRIKEVPAKMFERKYGESSIDAFKSIMYMIEVISSILMIVFIKRGKK